VTAIACIGEPVSWLRLEQLVLGELPATTAESVTAHVGACAACAACLAEISGDRVALPALPAVPARAASWWSRRWVFAAAAVAAAAAVLLFVLLPRRPDGRFTAGEQRIAVKGAGDVIVGLVRQRGEVIDRAPTTYAPGDAFKLVVTCAEAAQVWADVVVYQPESTGGPMVPSYPFAPMKLPCGNRVIVPGAFTITGDGPASACVALDVDRPPTREKLGRRKGIACYQLTRAK
jgi:hypothetical protein